MLGRSNVYTHRTPDYMLSSVQGTEWSSPIGPEPSSPDTVLSLVGIMMMLSQLSYVIKKQLRPLKAFHCVFMA